MIVSRIGLVSTVLAFGLTGCGVSIAPYPGFNSGGGPVDFQELVLNAAAAGRQTYDRDGRLIAIPGPMVQQASLAPEDMPLEMRRLDPVELDLKPVELAANLDVLPIPAIRPVIEVMDYLEVEEIKPKTSVLTMPIDEAVAKAASIKPATPSPRSETIAAIDELLVVDSEITAIRDDVVIQSEPAIAETGIVNVAFSPEPNTVGAAAAGLPLLVTSESAVISPEAPQATTNAASGTVETGILSLTNEEVDILLVQLEGDKTGLERVRSMTPEEKARLRTQYEKRSFLGHFAKMDRGNDGALTREEMMAYFTIMHAAFDVDYDNVVTRAEAPTLLLRIKLLGQGFPASGLTLGELERRLEDTFTFLDKNKNDKLGWPELL